MTKIRIDVKELERLRTIEHEHQGETTRTAALLDNVIDALGLRESYQDETTQRTKAVPLRYFTGDGTYTRWTERTVPHTVTGASEFKADVLKAADAAKGADALKRLRSAMKGARS